MRKNKVKRMRRVFKIAFYIRGNHVNKDGTCAIMIRICLDGERMSAGTTGICIHPDLWDGQRQQLRGRSTEALQTNRKLDGIRDEFQAISEKLSVKGELTLDRIKSVYQGTDEEYNTIGKLFDKYVQMVQEQVDVSLSKTSLSKYTLCKDRFMDMLKKKYHCKDMTLKELNPVVIEDYKNFLMADVGQCNNTAVKTMKTLRTVILHGIKLGVIHKDPFLGVHFHMVKVDRGFLTEEEIEALMTKKFDLPRLELVRDIFVFSCFTGLAYIDVKELKKENIVTLNNVEWIIASRVKTSTPINVVLFDGAKHIMKKYEGNPRCKGHIFPIMSNQKMNQYLKEIATACGIDKDITFHMARHTFATLTLSKGVPVETVSRMLGHTNIRTTQIYAKITNKKIEEDMTKFFADKKIISFGEESVNMTKTDEDKKGTKPRRRRTRQVAGNKL